MKITNLTFAIFGSMLLYGVSAYGVASFPGEIKYNQPDGSVIDVRLHGDEDCHWYTDLSGNLLMPLSDGTLTVADNLYSQQLAKKRKAPKAGGSSYTKFPTLGRQKALIILVEFADKKFKYDIEEFRNMLCTSGYSSMGAAGSAYDYFVENSAGRFIPDFEVYGPVTLSHPTSYYGSDNDALAHEMVSEACRSIDGFVDFSEFDRDNDGWVDNVYLFYAGYGEADGGGVNSVWPHAANLFNKGTRLNLDGVTIGSYSCSNELIGGTTRLVGIGTFCHEFSHVLGLPDLYSTNGNSAFTPYYYSLMDHGNYNGDGRVPCALTAYERYFLGWCEPEVLSYAGTVRIPPVSDNIAYRMSLPGYDEQYYLFENRKKEGWDAALPGEGLLIWHIDYSKDIWDRNGVNNDEERQRVNLIEADGIESLGSSAGDPFPGTKNVTSFASFKDHTGNLYSHHLDNIRKEGADILFDYDNASASPAVVRDLVCDSEDDNGFRLSWKEVEGADKYVVNLERVEQDRKIPVGNYSPVYCQTPEILITGLTPDTEYSCRVRALKNGTLSGQSEALSVRTLEAGIGYFAPRALEATEIGNNGFTANWEPLDKAEEYMLSLYKYDEEVTEKDLVEFLTPFTLPEGWTSTTSNLMSVKGYYGEAAPSLRFSQNAEYLESPVYDTEITSISFWMRGYKAATDASLTLSVLRNGKWETVKEITNINNTVGEIVEWTPANGKGNVKALRISFTASGNSSVCVDDVTVGFGMSKVKKLVFEKNVGNVTSYKIDSLEEGKNYSYVVKGINGEKESLASEEIPVTTFSGGPSQVTEITDDQQSVQIFTLTGIEVKSENSLSPGIYIEKRGNKTEKIIVQ